MSLKRIKEVNWDDALKKFILRDDRGKKTDVPVGGGAPKSVIIESYSLASVSGASIIFPFTESDVQSGDLDGIVALNESTHTFTFEEGHYRIDLTGYVDLASPGGMGRLLAAGTLTAGAPWYWMSASGYTPGGAAARVLPSSSLEGPVAAGDTLTCHVAGGDSGNVQVTDSGISLTITKLA